MTTPSRALVLSGGGNAGAAWMAGIISELQQQGADLAAGYDIVAVFSPVPLNDYLQATLDAEIKALSPAAVHVVLADQQSLAAIGPDALSATAARAAAEAGMAQARQEITALQAQWPNDFRTPTGQVLADQVTVPGARSATAG